MTSPINHAPIWECLRAHRSREIPHIRITNSFISTNILSIIYYERSFVDWFVNFLMCCQTSISFQHRWTRGQKRGSVWFPPRWHYQKQDGDFGTWCRLKLPSVAMKLFETFHKNVQTLGGILSFQMVVHHLSLAAEFEQTWAALPSCTTFQ